jgi:quercetin dioxygenase-like cupin family protein
MSEFISLDAVEWNPVRPDVTRGVFGKVLRDGAIKVVYARVDPGGGFSSHRDKYAHLLFILGGSGTIIVEGDEYEAKEGAIVNVSPGDEHSYHNRGMGI